MLEVGTALGQSTTGYGTVLHSPKIYFGQKLSMCVARMMKCEMNGLGGVRLEMARHLGSKEKGGECVMGAFHGQPTD